MLKDKLNPAIWDSKQQMLTQVRSVLLAVANSFFKQLDIDEAALKDVTLTGSIANYNWSEFSDVDLHLIVDFSKVDENRKLVQNYMLAQKNLWNEKHKLDIGGIPIEVYVENSGESHVASGLYSVKDDKWIVKPEPKKLMVDLADIRTKAQSYVSVLDHVKKYIKQGEYDKAIEVVEATKVKLKQLRSAGLETGGELSIENLAFKSLRRSGFIQALSDLAEEALAKMSSTVESKAGERRRSFYKPDVPKEKPRSFPVGGEAEIHKQGDRYYVVWMGWGHPSVLASFPAGPPDQKVAKGLKAAHVWARKQGIKIVKVVEMKASDLIDKMVNDDKSAEEVLNELTEAIVPTHWNQRWPHGNRSRMAPAGPREDYMEGVGKKYAAEMDRLGHEIAMMSGDPCWCDKCTGIDQ